MLRGVFLPGFDRATCQSSSTKLSNPLYSESDLNCNDLGEWPILSGGGTETRAEGKSESKAVRLIPLLCCELSPLLPVTAPTDLSIKTH